MASWARRHALKLATHLADCEVCRRKRDEFAGLSARVNALIASQPGGQTSTDWPELLTRLESRTSKVEPTPSKVMKRFAWGMALAAALAIGIVLAPKERTAISAPVAAASSVTASSIEVDGENFVPLPYSNPDLPVNPSRIIEMQVPVSSLAAAGILLGQYPDGTGDRTVAANVLLGLDGQPLAVHVLSAD